LYLTVQQMIERGGFFDFVIYAGGGGLRAREVRTVCVIDTADIESWLFGGEFLLTSGFLFKDDPEQLGSLIEMADRKNAAALGVKIGRYIDSIPQEVLRIADRLSFPLIGIPFHYAHTDIINPAVIAIAGRQSKMSEMSEEMRGRFLDALLEGDAPRSILSLLHEYARKDIMFLNAGTGERRAFPEDSEFARLAGNAPVSSLIERFRHEEIALKPSSFSPGAPKPGGYLFIDGHTPDEKALAALSHAKDALRLHLRWEFDLWKAERGRRTQFVQDVLYKRFKHASEIQGKARAFGWSLDGRQAVVLVGVDYARSSEQAREEPDIGAYEIFRSMLGKVQPGEIPYTPLKDGMAFVVAAPRDEWPRVKAALTEAFAAARRSARHETGLQLVLGVGSPADDLVDCDKSFREARRTAAMARDSETPAIPCFWEDMGVYKLLAPIYNTRESRDFLREHLGALMDHGKGAKTQDSLLQTLFCVIRNNWQLKPAAAAMNLHYNTIKYRYRRITEILGTDLDSYGERLCLVLAMELYALNGPSEASEAYPPD
jgi:purine catabolism regulator